MGLYTDENDTFIGGHDGYVVVKRENGRIEVWEDDCEGDDALFRLPVGFPEHFISSAISAFEMGTALGEKIGRGAAQHAIRAVLGL